MCEFKKATEKVGLRVHPDKTKILSNQSTIISNTKNILKSVKWAIEILTRNESVKYLGQRISFPPTRGTGNQEQDQSSLGDPSTNTDKS